MDCTSYLKNQKVDITQSLKQNIGKENTMITRKINNSYWTPETYVPEEVLEYSL